MGTFGGHALPGSFFIYFSLWAIFWALKRFYARRAYELQLSDKPVPPYKNRVSFPLPTPETGCCRGKPIPLDSYLKAITCIVGITGEVITGFDDNSKFVHIGNAQHSTMYATFGLSGIVELCMFYGLLKVPIQVEHVFVMTALLSQGFLFFFHLHGRTPVDVYVHMLLAGMIVVAIVSALFEAIKSNEVTWLLLRNWSLLMQGTWFWQIGAVLYPATSWMPTWDERAKESIPRAANLFCYHMLVDFMAIVLIATVFSLRSGRMNSRAVLARTDVARRNLVPANESLNNPEMEQEMWNAERAANWNETDAIPLEVPAGK